MKEEGSLIHGSVQLSAEGPRIDHAWVELPTGWIWEPQTKGYYTKADFKIFKPVEENRYTGEEAAIMLTRVGKHGPWTEEEREQFLKRGNPGDVPEVDITKGVIKRGGKLIANPGNIPAARAFVAELRRLADKAEKQALASTESKAQRLMQNARQARKDADNIEKTIPNPSPSTPESVAESKVIDVTTTDLPHYDQLMKLPEYFAEAKGEKGTIIWMTPDEAIAKGAGIHDVLISEELRGVLPSLVDEYAEQMKAGKKFPLPVLDYKRGDQEGRHRILAAKQAGETRVPILIVEEANPSASESGYLDDILPMSPSEGPPLPRGLGLKWPWRK